MNFVQEGSQFLPELFSNGTSGRNGKGSAVAGKISNRPSLTPAFPHMQHCPHQGGLSTEQMEAPHCSGKGGAGGAADMGRRRTLVLPTRQEG